MAGNFCRVAIFGTLVASVSKIALILKECHPRSQGSIAIVRYPSFWVFARKFYKEIKVPNYYLWLPAGISSHTPTAAISVSSLWGAIQSFTTSCRQHRSGQRKMRFTEVSECGQRKTDVTFVDLPCKPLVLSCRVHVFWRLFPWAST